MDKRSAHFAVFISIKPLALLAVLFFHMACQPVESSEIIEDSTSEIPGSKTADLPKLTPKGGLTTETVESFLSQYADLHNDDILLIHTDLGDIMLQLYRNTPLHRANFIYLTQAGYFNGTWFYRVSPGHVIQAGNNDQSATGKKRRAIGDYKIPNEIGAGNLHLRGALAAARTYYQNPDKMSNPYEFYIVIGKDYSQSQLELLAEKEGFDLNSSQIKAYSNTPGSPHLDSEHTVFGRVISGMETVMAISKVDTDEGEWPLEIIPIELEVVAD